MAETVSCYVYRHAGGVGLSVNDVRVSGPKPLGGADVLHSFDVPLAGLLLALRSTEPATPPLFNADRDTPQSAAQALRVLAAFARTAPGRLPERVEKALALADLYAFPGSGRAAALGVQSLAVSVGDFVSVAVDEAGRPIQSTTVEAYELRSLQLKTKGRLSVESNAWLSSHTREEAPMVLLSRVGFEVLLMLAVGP